MAFSRLFSRAEHKVLGDGNCAFNAFSIGFCDEITAIEQHVQRQGQTPDQLFDGFIQKASAALNIKKSNWQVLRENLFHLYHRDQQQFQKKMAPIMRNLAIGLTEQDPQQVEKTKQQLLSAFDDYRLKHKFQQSYGVQDDIFSRHTFIQNQFNKLLSEPPGQAEEQLWRWWTCKNGGYKQFLGEMRRNGVWAGDLELSKLAGYFKVNLDVWREGFMHHVYYDFGSMSAAWFTQDQVSQLISRSIVERQDTQEDILKLFNLSELEVSRHLQAVVGSAGLINYMLSQPFLKNTPLPQQFSAISTELQHRNVIEKRSDAYFFVLDHEAAIERVSAVPDDEYVLECWRKCFVAAPTIILQHESEVHWSNYKQPLALPAKPGLSLWFSTYQYASSFAQYCCALYYVFTSVSPMRVVTAVLPGLDVPSLLTVSSSCVKSAVISADCAASGDELSAHKTLVKTKQSEAVMPCRIL